MSTPSLTTTLQLHPGTLLGFPIQTASFPWEVTVTPGEGIQYLLYSTLFCVAFQTFLRQFFLIFLPLISHPRPFVAPRVATKLVSILMNLISVQGSLKYILASEFLSDNATTFGADPTGLTERLFGFSSHSQFHFAVAAGYFLWAFGASLLYKGSKVAIFHHFVCFLLCFFGLTPFMHGPGNVFLLSQASNLVIDCYGFGVLLLSRKKKSNVFLKYLHPVVFFLVRIVYMVPISYFLLLDLTALLSTGAREGALLSNGGGPDSLLVPASHQHLITKPSIYVLIAAVVATNLLNIYWFISLLAGSVASTLSANAGVTSVTLNRELMKVKWFAFNLNWYDVGFTLSFGDVRVGTDLKIDNSSYERATPGLAVPSLIIAICVKVVKTVELSEEPFWDSLIITVAAVVAVKAVMFINHRAAKIGFWVTTEKKQTPKNAQLFHSTPTITRMVSTVSLSYNNTPNLKLGGEDNLLSSIMTNTPRPQGREEFTTIHVIAPPTAIRSSTAEKIVFNLQFQAKDANKECVVHRLLDVSSSQEPMDEYNTVFDVASNLVLKKADRASLIVFVGWEDTSMDFYGAMIAMLPFRGVHLALITQRKLYGDLFDFKSRSGVFRIEGKNAGRMGMFPVKAVFGPLPDKSFSTSIDDWKPVDIEPYLEHEDQVNHPTVNLPFKIGALTLPMLTHNGSYEYSLASLKDLLKNHYKSTGFFPIVSCGETCDALGYGTDILEALKSDKDLCPAGGYYFHHKSGETYKCFENYGTVELFKQVALAKAKNVPVTVIAVGGGVNGNCIGLIAGLINSNLIEIPTTPMHYNDATTSAKKAFSLVKENKILSKNILGCFYIPQLVFNVSETFLTLSTANVHATIGESCKTMNMLGRCDSKTGAQDYFNIEGAVEFSSDYTKIVLEVGGFDIFVEFVESKETAALKAEIIKVGRKMREARVAPSEIKKLEKKRGELLNAFRGRYYELGTEKTNSVKSFLSTVNKEIVSAKAMFLAYSDPFEKYRALLFEYAHTLGHGVEAFANLCYTRALEQGVDVPESAQRLHGQCVGMAVLMAGQMSSDLGQLQGDGFAMHQGLVYLFNRHGGFDFKPLRLLFDSLGVSKSDFCEGVLDVVRRDNKRGYIQCDDCTKSVDQLVTGRIGKMMRSTDKNAELRYLVEVDEDWQRKVLGMAFDGKFDKVADIDDEGKLRFREREQLRKGEKVLVASSFEVGEFLHEAIASVYGV